MSRAIVLEVNEMLIRVRDWWRARVPDSARAQLAGSGSIEETRDYRSQHHGPRGLLIANEFHSWTEMNAVDVIPVLVEVPGIHPLGRHKSLASYL